MTDFPTGVSAFAGKRGGPSLYDGVAYQTGVSLLIVLERLIQRRTQQPLLACAFRCEAREVVDVGNGFGQLTYDLGVEQDGHTTFHEMKANPTAAEVKAFVSRLSRHRGEPVSLLLCHGEDTPFSDALVTLVDNAAEADGHDDRLLRLVTASPNHRLAELVAELDSGPAALLRQMRRPQGRSPLSVEDLVNLCAAVLAPEGKQRDLVRELTGRLEEAFRARETINVADFDALLDGLGLLKPWAAVLPATASGDLHPALYVLGLCRGVPLRASVLAAGLGLDAAELETLLRGHVASGQVVRIDDGLCVPVALPLSGSPRCTEVAAAVLAALLGLPDSEQLERVRQAPNVVALARDLVHLRPDLVARAFKTYDKPIKAAGNFSLIRQLARLSIAATETTEDTGADSPLFLRAHARICGTSWVAQRTGELDEAMVEMARARQESEVAESADNLAFIDKCSGRFQRLEAERFLAAGDAESARTELENSAASLLRGYDQFTELVSSPEFSRLDEEPGECFALLARTYLVGGNLDDAEAACVRAHELLDGLSKPRKAWADACLVDAEVALARAQAGADPVAAAALIAEHVTRITDAVGQFSVSGADGIFDPGASEIVARGYRVLGALHVARGDRPAAAAALRTAAGLFEELGQLDDGYDCTWRGARLDDAVPARLATALHDASADPGTSVESLNVHRERGTADDYPEESYWRGVVSAGRRRATSRVYPLRDQLTG